MILPTEIYKEIQKLEKKYIIIYKSEDERTYLLLKARKTIGESHWDSIVSLNRIISLKQGFFYSLTEAKEIINRFKNKNISIYEFKFKKYDSSN